MAREMTGALRLSTDADTACLWHGFVDRYMSRRSGSDRALREVIEADPGLAVARAAAILLALRDATGVRPHAYFEWAEGNPLAHLMRYLLLGRGDTAPVVREIIRENEPDPRRRPGIHVG